MSIVVHVYVYVYVYVYVSVYIRMVIMITMATLDVLDGPSPYEALLE